MAGKASRGGGLWPWLGLALVILLLDQFTKALIVGYYRLGDVTYVTSFFNIVRVHNPGAAFSFLAGAGGWQRWFFIALGLGAAGFALCCILGGALGNVIDRLVHGYVVDMLDFHFRFLEPVFRGGHFPAFNLADSAISLGAFCLILDEILRVRRSR